MKLLKEIEENAKTQTKEVMDEINSRKREIQIKHNPVQQQEEDYEVEREKILRDMELARQETEDERKRKLEKQRFEKLQINNDIDNEEDFILINEPRVNYGMQQVRNIVSTTSWENREMRSKEGDPYKAYYLNAVNSLEGMYNYVDHIYEKNVKPFKMSCAFGYVKEAPIESLKGKEKEDDNSSDFEYYPWVPTTNLKRNRVITITNEDDLEEIYELINRSVIEDVQTNEGDPGAASGVVFICLFMVGFFVYKLQKSTGKLPLIKEFLNNKYIYSYNEDNNLCVVAAHIAFESKKLPANTRSMTSLAKQKLAQFWGLDASSRKKDSKFNQRLAEFDGFVLTEECMEEYCNYFKINFVI